MFRIILERDLNQMWWFYFLVTGLQLTCVFTWGWRSGKTYCSCYSLLLLFITSMKILACLREINCNGLLKRTNVNINSFYKKSKHICLCLSLCVQFSVYFCQCEYVCVYVDLVVLLNATYWFVCDVLIKNILTSSTMSSKC